MDKATENVSGAPAEDARAGEASPSPRSEDPQAVAEEKPMSKSQMKRKRRHEKLMEVKKRKRQQDRDMKRAKALADGRDLEAERRLLEERTASGEGHRRRQQAWEKKKLPLARQSFQACLDCAFESSMTEKEISSLALQIRYCYANNKRNPHPCLLAATSLGGKTLEHLQNVAGFDEWNQRAFTCTEQSLEKYYKDNLDNIVYLTSDSENTLTDLDDSKIYIIGGIVDRNRLKRMALTRAEELGVATAKLPIDAHLKTMEATRVLTCNHVFEILLQYRQNGKDWQKALLKVLPKRKDAKAVDTDKKEK